MRVAPRFAGARAQRNTPPVHYDPGINPMRMPELTLPPPAPQAMLREGAVLGVWRLRVALHGRNVMDGSQSGQWYSAHHALAADRHCNVLVLPRCERSAGIMLRFGDQVSDLAALAHPVIKVPNDSGITADGQPYLIFDACDGQPIVRACSSQPLRARLQLIVQFCEALRYAHQQGWLLGEIDPALLWVGSDKQLKLLGMGLLRIPDPDYPFERGLGLGSALGFASPEALAGGPAGFASEVYGVGALLCLLVDGRVPGLLDADTGELSPAASWPGLTALERFSLDALLRKAVAPQAARRYSGVEALAEDLRSWLAGEDHSALVLTPMPVTSTSGAMAYESRLPAWPARSTPSRRALWAGLALAGMAVLSAGVWFGPQVWSQSFASNKLQPAPSAAEVLDKSVEAKPAALLSKAHILVLNAVSTPELGPARAQSRVQPEPFVPAVDAAASAAMLSAQSGAGE